MDKSVDALIEVLWIPTGPETPRGCLLQLLGEGEVPCYGIYFGEKFWTHWQHVPKKPSDWKAEGSTKSPDLK